MDLSALGTDIERVVVSEEQIQNRLKELADQVNKDYAGRDLILVGVLKGAIMAMADFSRHLHVPELGLFRSASVRECWPSPRPVVGFGLGGMR